MANQGGFEKEENERIIQVWDKFTQLSQRKDK